MDLIEVRLLRALGGGILAPEPDSYRIRALARDVGVSPPTVRDRLDALRRSGALGNLNVFLNPRLLGWTIESSLWRIREEEKPYALRRLRASMHLSVRDFFGDLALVAFWHRTPKEREERFGSIARATAGEWLGPAYDDYFAPDPPMPSALDRRILAEHVADATASAETLHLRVGASARRVRASLRQMWNAGVYIHEWRLNRSRVKRAVPFILHVRATPGKAGALARRLQTLFDDTLLAAIPPPARATSACYVVLAANSLEQTEELRERALRAPEASLVLPLLPRSGWDDYSEYEKERDAFLARQ